MPYPGHHPPRPEQPGEVAITISHTLLAISEWLYRDDNEDTRGGTVERGRCVQLVSSVEFPVSRSRDEEGYGQRFRFKYLDPLSYRPTLTLPGQTRQHEMPIRRSEHSWGPRNWSVVMGSWPLQVEPLAIRSGFRFLGRGK
jgi:hypothetical protein